MAAGASVVGVASSWRGRSAAVAASCSYPREINEVDLECGLPPSPRRPTPVPTQLAPMAAKARLAQASPIPQWLHRLRRRRHGLRLRIR
ncbi:hypothetical protein OsJ_27538 [Oryza sativa Japonica Group]|uniref:Uncharacterized protein n=1 Tax=Oryza sativa subsp. japonica TaxID=39947 RepID=A3BTQ9_ORYSJ|nr:hypothetical protein OsJ_27538 [Oryza sativa Japonica Group]